MLNTFPNMLITYLACKNIALISQGMEPNSHKRSINSFIIFFLCLSVILTHSIPSTSFQQIAIMSGITLCWLFCPMISIFVLEAFQKICEDGAYDVVILQTKKLRLESIRGLPRS